MSIKYLNKDNLVGFVKSCMLLSGAAICFYSMSSMFVKHGTFCRYFNQIKANSFKYSNLADHGVPDLSKIKPLDERTLEISKDYPGITFTEETYQVNDKYFVLHRANNKLYQVIHDDDGQEPYLKLLRDDDGDGIFDICADKRIGDLPKWQDSIKPVN
jgi:hypothetical protein